MIPGIISEPGIAEPLNPERREGASPPALKRCRGCLEEKPIAQYGKQQKWWGIWVNTHCRVCDAKRVRLYRMANLEKVKARERRHNHSLEGQKSHKKYVESHRVLLNQKAHQTYWKNPEKSRAIAMKAYEKKGPEYQKLQLRKKKGTLNQACMICGEHRIVEWCHIIPRRKGGVSEPWNILYLCPTHHRLLDIARNLFIPAEWQRIAPQVEMAERQ